MKRYLPYAFLHGGLAALCCILFFVLLYVSSDNPLNERRPDLGFNILFIFTSIYFFRRRNKGVLHFYEGFSVGFLTNMVAILVTGSFMYIFIKFIDFQPFQTWIDSSIAFLNDQKEALSTILNEENFKRQQASLSNSKPYQLFLDELFFKQIAIVAITLTSMALRKH